MSEEKKVNNALSDEELEQISGGEGDCIHIQIPMQKYVCHTPKTTTISPLAVCGNIWAEPAGDPNPQCPECGGYLVEKIGGEFLTP